MNGCSGTTSPQPKSDLSIIGRSIPRLEDERLWHWRRDAAVEAPVGAPKERIDLKVDSSGVEMIDAPRRHALVRRPRGLVEQSLHATAALLECSLLT
jgi:hypothetical protein